MKVNVLDTIKNYDGSDLVNSEGKAVTLRDVISQACNTVLPSEDLQAEEKTKLFQISMAVHNGEVVNLPVEQVATIKERIGRVYTPLVYGRASELLDGSN